MNKSFLQTTEWLKFQESIGHKAWRFDDSQIRANIIQHKVAFSKNYLYIPHGPEILFNNISGGLKNEVDNFLRYLKNLGKENKSIFVKIEPLTDLALETIFRKGIKRSQKHIQPSRTVIINLNLPEEDLLSRMHHKTRYNIHLAEKKDLRLEESTDTETFWKLLQRTAKKDRFYTHTKDYYEKLLKFFQGGELKTRLFFVLYNGRHIAGAIVLMYDDTIYYLHGAMDRDYKELMAPYFMHWEIMRRAKTQSFDNTQDRGCHYYDLWGIDAQKWPGVTRFKLGWGGDVKEYPGSFDLTISKFWYLVYKIARRVF
ncbi:MAG: hypothetical protein A3J47_01600 [Candidatus Yanofskybacteria bacterium RIFCSPHIGHO2_02_FULL_43_22]|uniref:BioF2-like acetyltransferase domain-containing protein n=1 Tax=Candidatus Yanofskybacteria bacterium RIFCSPHIGHO2_02_FULL_43_22 TaxID=1802681 RepID=A0A1F8FK80_9BACT|nr:MAG: hypothetical protein A3J47_01600 [Candidatus Yanofskybacteria bacterium RIFCSPHIGHO2_02_FULL_43_22]